MLGVQAQGIFEALVHSHVCMWYIVIRAYIRVCIYVCVYTGLETRTSFNFLHGHKLRLVWGGYD